MEGWQLFALFIGLFAIAAGVGAYLEQRRSQAIEAVANDWGFSFLKNAQHGLPQTVMQFHLFNKGRNRHFKNLIQGQQGDVSVSMADYTYVTGSGKHRTTHRQTIVVVESSHLSLPSFLLTPENMFHKIGGLFGYDDIDFDSHPTFSARYLLKGSDEAAIRDCFQDGVLAFYERQQQVCSEGIGSFLLYYKTRHSVAPTDWKQLMGAVLEAHEQFAQRY